MRVGIWGRGITVPKLSRPQVETERGEETALKPPRRQNQNDELMAQLPRKRLEAPLTKAE